MIKNTAKTPGTGNLESLLFRGPNFIKIQEADGQEELINSSCLPTQIQNKEKLEEMGIKFGKVCKDDPLFCHAQLPKGWRKKKSEHSMWSYIIDEKGVEKASIFYKAAFYDRRAFIRPFNKGDS